MATTPTLSVQGTIRVDAPNLQSEEALSAAMEGITAHNPVLIELAPGELNKVVTPPDSPATVVSINTNRKIRLRLNGGTEDYILGRLALLVDTSITQIELFNDQLAQPEGVNVSIAFASGGTIV